MKFDFEDSGAGPALLFLPGSYSTGKGWRGVTQALRGNYRVITSSLPGYGGTSEVRADGVADMDEMTDFVARVVERAGEPVHLVAHSYGGLCAFAAAMSGKVSPLSMITFEANPIYSRPDQGDFAWRDEVHSMTDRFEAGHAKDDPDTAGIIIDFWSRDGMFAALPDAFREYCRQTVYSNILDWRSGAGFQPAMSEYGRLDLPCTIVRGEHCNRMMADISEAMHREIPASKQEVVSGADHFLISTHAEACASLIDAHMREFEGKA